MLGFAAARDLLLERTPESPPVRVDLDEAVGQVLRERLVADRPQPPYDRVMMDGFALRAADWATGRREFKVAGMGLAGAPAAVLGEAVGGCVEIMTGAPMAVGADCVVPIEWVATRAGHEVLFAQRGQVVAGNFIHRMGSDVLAGEVLVEPGVVLGAREIGVAATFGYADLAVSKVPKIAVVATGDELVAVGEHPGAHQIRQSNGHALLAALARAGYPVATARTLGDDDVRAVTVLGDLLETHDWLVLTGAVSKGAKDFVPDVLGRLGCQPLFHGVAQRPGKPLGCWLAPGGRMVLALPGNPVSALTGLQAFLVPALDRALGRVGTRRQVMLAGSVRASEDLTLHLPVTLDAAGGASAAPTANSGDFTGLLRSTGFVTLPPASAPALGPRFVSYTPWL